LVNKQDIIDNYIKNLSPDGVIQKFLECKAEKFPSFLDFKFRGTCLEELKEIIRSANVNNSPGLDSLIDYQILKLIPDSALIGLLEIFELILAGNYFPEKAFCYSSSETIES